MSKIGYLILENGQIFEGEYFGAEGEVLGEIVFTTGMTGYLETITDPNYHGQIVLQTFPLIGNYGVIPSDFENDNIGLAAYIAKYPCQEPSNFRSEGNLDTFFKQKNIVGLCGIDTRMLTKIIRENGTMNGKITSQNPENQKLEEIKNYKTENAVEKVSVKEVLEHKSESSKYKVALLDFGVKQSIVKELLGKNCSVYQFPHNSSFEEILKIAPDGILLSNGPGDPRVNVKISENIKKMLEAKIPIMGIGLGHQLLALANGFEIQKLNHGHRGANQSVKDMQTGKVQITNQNHGYVVLSDSVNKAVAEERFVNVNDKTCEGLDYRDVPAFSVQFHPEGFSDSLGNECLFDKFIKNMEGNKNAVR